MPRKFKSCLERVFQEVDCLLAPFAQLAVISFDVKILQVGCGNSLVVAT